MNKDQKEGRLGRIYEQLLPMLEKSPDHIAAMATVSAVLHAKMEDYFWCGFYFVRNNELVVGPYQGPPACQILTKPNGVCWASVLQVETLVVPDVHAFPGHIACDSRSNSEIVVPLLNPHKEVWAVLDVDSTQFNTFCEIDAHWLQKIVQLIKL
jgi:L-methionine (R)-S-oxide reductase